MRRGTRRLAQVATLALIAAFAAGEGVARAALGDIFTVAGTGTAGFSGDGVAATAAQLNTPTAVTAMPDGGFLVTDQVNWRIRRVFPTGIIATVAGNGSQGFGGDGGPAASASLDAPNGTAVLPDGSILIADSSNHRIRRVDPSGTITTVAGTGAPGLSGDGGPATAAQLNFPIGLAALANGGYLIADTDNHSIRQVSPGGTITTVAGVGFAAFGGDEGLATAAGLNKPTGVAVTPGGGFLIADRTNHRIRQVAPDGVIRTVAGNGTVGPGGDGGPATAAQFSEPTTVAVTSDGGYVISDSFNNRIRKVSPAGIITTVAGGGTGGDNGPATAALLNRAIGVAVDTAGNYLIADLFNHRVRFVENAVPAVQTPPPPPPAPTPVPVPVANKSVVGTELRGRVLVRVPGSKRFVDLNAVTSLPLGTVVNATAGRISITAAANNKGATQTAVFYDGIFKLGQTGPIRKLTTVLALFGNEPKCAKPRKAKPKRSNAAAKKSKSRRLWGDGKGRFQTKGRYSSATVRGTKWLVEDNCKGTLTKVAKGSVTVRDFVKGKNVIVKAGDTYLAKAGK